MNLVVLGLGVFLIAVAVYTASDPLSRARLWVSFEDMERELTPDRFVAYDGAADAELRLAFDHAGYGAEGENGNGDSVPTPIE